MAVQFRISNFEIRNFGPASEGTPSSLSGERCRQSAVGCRQTEEGRSWILGVGC